MDNSVIRLQIAKAAIGARMTREEAKQWVDWVLEEQLASAGLSAAPSPGEDLFTDDQLEEALWDQFGGCGRISWIDFIYAIRYDSELSLKISIACCALYGIERKTRDVIIKAVESKAVEGTIPYGCDGYGHSCIQGKYHINKLSLVRWLDTNYSFRGTGIVKQFWESFLLNFKLR